MRRLRCPRPFSDVQGREDVAICRRRRQAGAHCACFVGVRSLFRAGYGMQHVAAHLGCGQEGDANIQRSSGVQTGCARLQVGNQSVEGGRCETDSGRRLLSRAYLSRVQKGGEESEKGKRRANVSEEQERSRGMRASRSRWRLDSPRVTRITRTNHRLCGGRALADHVPACQEN